jgi:tetratricopeptide (TPR) repeat protein
MGRGVNEDRSRSLAAADDQVRRGQAHESRGEYPAALACYGSAIDRLAALPGCAETQRPLAVAWMNRGNAFQKQATRLSLNHAVCAYDRAIALLGPLASAAPADHSLRNSLGAAHLNRAGALLAFAAPAAALAAAAQAIATLTPLPLAENPFYRANLAGAWLNRATALLPADPVAAQLAARTALDLAVPAERTHFTAAHVALGARRTLLAGLGHEFSPALAEPAVRRDPARLLAAASDLIDDGLALARRWEAQRVTAFRPAAAQLFHAGAVLYAAHQPHFVAEFLAENQALATALPVVVQTMLARARRTAHERSRVIDATDPLSRTVATLSDLNALGQSFAALFPLAGPAAALSS